MVHVGACPSDPNSSSNASLGFPFVSWVHRLGTRPRGAVPNLDPVGFIRDVKDSLLDLVVDLPRRVDEGLLDVVRGLGGGLHEDQPVLFGEGLPLLRGHRPPVSQVRLVADEHDGHIRVRVLPGVVKPGRQGVEGLPPGDVVHQKRPRGAPVVTSRDAPEALLPRRVPDLQLYLLSVDGHHAGTELHTNSQVVHRLKPLVGELQEQARFAHARVADNDVLEEVP
eukprot:CAMPEP_0196639540 /NCGR_PEP_ID=MMETSP1085-20130531/2100_1 /TAXON_ID=41879 ORGANISM="Pycnococcus sp, Strain CCMP1998" /NCGR_SAMPLE_ID=MMETSP1085 /ASSEMBLY_ACC=CAM_ASM_000807 /LENGTH=223 /DNA_ID=CAMNT_0041968585 /DNA_START=143 /DNA_END=815 /DNA_ORIENTATION=+